MVLHDIVKSIFSGTVVLSGLRRPSRTSTWLHSKEEDMIYIRCVPVNKTTEFGLTRG